MNRKEAVLIATWVIVLLIGLVIPQCTRESAENARDQYENIQNNVVEGQVD